MLFTDVGIEDGGTIISQRNRLCWPESLVGQSGEKALVRLDMYQRSTQVESLSDSDLDGMFWAPGDEVLSVLRVLDYRITLNETKLQTNMIYFETCCKILL